MNNDVPKATIVGAPAAANVAAPGDRRPLIPTVDPLAGAPGLNRSMILSGRCLTLGWTRISVQTQQPIPRGYASVRVPFWFFLNSITFFPTAGETSYANWNLYATDDTDQAAYNGQTVQLPNAVLRVIDGGGAIGQLTAFYPSVPILTVPLAYISQKADQFLVLFIDTSNLSNSISALATVWEIVPP